MPLPMTRCPTSQIAWRRWGWVALFWPGLTSCAGDTQELFDVRSEMVETAEGCEDVDGTPTAGGREYAWGEYDKDFDGTWRGSEAVYFFANESWIESGGSDCFILWDASAVGGSLGDCRDCELGLSVTATVDEYGTDCPDDMWYGRSYFTAGYAANQEADSTASWIFSGSGKHFADGYWVSGSTNFLSDAECVWL